MGYGHLRAINPLKIYSDNDIVILGQNDGSSENEIKEWNNARNIYEWFSKISQFPIIGKIIYNIINLLFYIPNFKTKLNHAKPTFQVKFLDKKIRKNNFSSAFLNKLDKENDIILTTFYTSAIAAEINNFKNIYCVICDSDINRVWVSKDSDKSNIVYFAPCESVVERLLSYGVNRNKIHLTGFPLSNELIGENMNVVKSNLVNRLHNLDRNKLFLSQNKNVIEKRLGSFNEVETINKKITISFVVGGAGAQTNIAETIISNLSDLLNSDVIELNLFAGIRTEAKLYFEGIIQKYKTKNVNILFYASIQEYFTDFEQKLNQTDILWTKPSELSFYTSLGLPIIISLPIGHHENYNCEWILNNKSGVKYLENLNLKNWLISNLAEGKFAEMAWNGFANGKISGTKKIYEIICKECDINLVKCS